MVDFVRLANTAKRLIDANGRTITVNQKQTTSADTDKPWREATGGNANTFTVIGVEASSRSTNTAAKRTSFIEGAILREEQSAFIVNALDAGDRDLSVYDELVDGNDVYSIDAIDSLKPGPIVVIYEFIVSK